MSNEIVAYQHAIMPVMDIVQAVARRKAIVQFTKSVMQSGVHFGKIPGTSKDTLLKPGAEMLTTFFGLSPRFVVEEKTLDWMGTDHGGEPFFHFQYRCQLWRGDLLVGEGLGSCNSWEKKYRYRKGSASCPECGAEAISRSRYPPRGAPPGTPNGWWCRECKADFAHDDPKITGQSIGRVVNDNPADLVNTVDKMAQKRALVGATLIAVNASEFFTQDLEDMDVVEGTIESPAPSNGGNHKPQRKAPAPKAEPKSPEEWADLPVPVDFAELWDKERYLELGYDHKNHALNTLTGKNGIFKGQKLNEDIDIVTAWASLVDHQRAKMDAETEGA